MRPFTARLTGELSVRCLSFLFTFQLARVMGTSSFGLFAIAFAYGSLFSTLADFGVNPVLVRILQSAPESRLAALRSANGWKLAAALAAWAALYLASRAFALALGHPRLVETLGAVVIAYTLIDYFGATLAGRDEPGWEAVLRATSRAIMVAAGLAALYASRSLIAVAIALAAAAGAAIVWAVFLVYRRYGSFPVGWSGSLIRAVAGGAWPLFGATLLWTLYANQGVLLLRYYSARPSQIGLFWSAARIVDGLRAAPVLLSAAFFPILIRYAAARESFLEAARTLLAWALLFGLAVGGILFFGAPLLERWIYGEAYVEATPQLRMLALAYLPMGLNYVAMQILVAKRQERHVLPGAFLACAAQFLFGLYWIPRQGALGACQAVAASEALTLVFQLQQVTQAVPALLNPFRRTYG